MIDSIITVFLLLAMAVMALYRSSYHKDGNPCFLTETIPTLSGALRVSLLSAYISPQNTITRFRIWFPASDTFVSAFSL